MLKWLARLWRGSGCQHDWQSLGINSEDRLIEECLSPDRPMRVWGGKIYHVRVCMKCQAVDDTIAPARERIAREFAERDARMNRAKAIYQEKTNGHSNHP
jgi:hypothetical protein